MTRHFGFSAKFLGSANARETSARSRMPSGIRVPQVPTTLIFPRETSRRVADGGRQRAGSHGVTQYYANSIPLPPDPHGLTPRALLKRGYVTQALIDSTAVLFSFLFVLSLALSLPLAVFLLFVARF